jgi:hypothetical protein
MASLATTTQGETKNNASVLNCKWAKIRFTTEYVPNLTTVGQLKEVIAEETSIPKENVKLLNLKIKHRKLDDCCLVSDCKLPKILKIMGTAQEDLTRQEQLVTASKNEPSFFTNQFTWDSDLVLTYEDSVKEMNAGIARNKYNHHHGDKASNPHTCLHERISAWDIGKCSACGAQLAQSRVDDENNIAERLKQEDRTKAQVQPHNHRIHALGIRVDALVAFAYAHNCWNWTTKRVVRDIIVPATKGTRCRYGDLTKMSQFFGPAKVFVSHCWGAKFGELVSAVCHNARTDRVVWIDIFAVRQWPGNRDDLDFRSVLKRCKAMIVTVTPVECMCDENLYDDLFDEEYGYEKRNTFLSSKQFKAAKTILAFFRLWCVVEIAAAVQYNIPIIIKHGTFDEIQTHLFSNGVMYEYSTGEDVRHSLSTMMDNLTGFVDDTIMMQQLDCASPVDHKREMAIIQSMDGGAHRLTTILGNVLLAANRSIKANVLEIDSYYCGEPEALLNMNIFTLSDEKERSTANTVMTIAYWSQRWDLIIFLLKKWIEKEETAVEKEKRAHQIYAAQGAQQEEGGETGERKCHQSVGKKETMEKTWLCRFVEDQWLHKFISGRVLHQYTEKEGSSTFTTGVLNILKIFLDLDGIDVNKIGGYHNKTPLYVACAESNVELIKLLVNAKGIDVNDDSYDHALKLLKTSTDTDTDTTCNVSTR